jgi:hypothetical protein
LIEVVSRIPQSSSLPPGRDFHVKKPLVSPGERIEIDRFILVEPESIELRDRIFPKKPFLYLRTSVAT